jgi:hypothetical protein
VATNSSLITALAQAVKDAEAQKRDRDIYAQVLTDAQDWVTEETECLRKVDSTSVVLVAGTREYTLPTTFIKFPTEEQESTPCPVQLGTTGKFQLQMVSPLKLEVQVPGWRAVSAGTPQLCYIVREGLLKIGFYPAPSAAFIATNGSKVFLDHIFRPAAIIDDASTPFDGSVALQGLQQLLKMRAQWQIWLEDKDFVAADRFEKETERLLEHAKDLVQSVYSLPGTTGFGQSVSQY